MDKLKPSLDKGTWYQSAVSGMWYRDEEAAGDICAVRINGKTIYRPEPEDSTAPRGQEKE